MTAEAGAGSVAVTVEDNGVGIPPAMLPRVFDMFTQLQEHRDRTLGGLGIGLALAKRLIELHGGTIDAHSGGTGRGSRFTTSLPVAATAPRLQPPPVERVRAAPSPCRVLVADDSPDTAEMMRVMLGLSGHDVRTASDGVEAVAIAGSFDPQIALLDIGMPRMDGYEAARAIRLLLGDRVTLVALTGWGQDEDKRRSREAGFDHHLTKPPDPDALDRLIHECSAGVAPSRVRP